MCVSSHLYVHCDNYVTWIIKIVWYYNGRNFAAKLVPGSGEWKKAHKMYLHTDPEVDTRWKGENMGQLIRIERLAPSQWHPKRFISIFLTILIKPGMSNQAKLRAERNHWEGNKSFKTWKYLVWGRFIIYLWKQTCDQLPGTGLYLKVSRS